MRALFRCSLLKQICQVYRNDISGNCYNNRSWLIPKKDYCALPQNKLQQFDRSLIDNYVKQLTSAYNNKDFDFGQYLKDYDHNQIREISDKLDNIDKKTNEAVQLEGMIQDGSNDEEMKDLIKEEIETIKLEVSTLKNGIITELLDSKEKSTNGDVMFEVSAGVGGQEAMLFTQDIYQMYEKYFNYKGWDYEVISEGETELGGTRQATILISGNDVYNQLKFEGGVHRVQRIPKTERGGRLHTSTMKVVVLLQPNEIEIVLNPKDLKIETCKASGKGGQHVNTTDSAVRIVHIPTGIVSECQTQRSQIKNKETALKVLRSRLYEREEKQVQQELKNSRLLQVTSANRNEKIRTFNFKDDRVTDHRIGQSFYNLELFFEGGQLLDDFINNLRVEYKKELLINKMKNIEDLVKK